MHFLPIQFSAVMISAIKRIYAASLGSQGIPCPIPLGEAAPFSSRVLLLSEFRVRLCLPAAYICETISLVTAGRTMESSISTWKDFFSHWPTNVHRRGILITAFNEQIPFSNFNYSPEFLFIERQTPDSLGARIILLRFDQIVSLKIMDVLKPRQFPEVGFDSGPTKS